MLSYISNSDRKNWLKSWIFALALTIVLLVSLEFFWRAQGHKPAIVDNQRLWATERSKIGKSGKEIVLLGSSRMQTDISTETLHDLAPAYSIVNLAIDASCANAVLRDLADENNFKGIVLCDMTAECLLFGDDDDLGQQAYVNYHRNIYNLNSKVNHIIAIWTQKNFTIVDPYLNLVKLFGNLLFKGEWRQPYYVTTHEDRTCSANYAGLNLNAHRENRMKKVQSLYNKLSPNISINSFMEKISDIENAVEKIHSRGGKVVFIRFPVSGEHWIIDEKYFARKKFWDVFASTTSAEVIHFIDVKGLSKLECPDTSHLDFRDKPLFTLSLFNELVRKKVL